MANIMVAWCRLHCDEGRKCCQLKATLRRLLYLWNRFFWTIVNLHICLTCENGRLHPHNLFVAEQFYRSHCSAIPPPHSILSPEFYTINLGERNRTWQIESDSIADHHIIFDWCTKNLAAGPYFNPEIRAWNHAIYSTNGFSSDTMPKTNPKCIYQKWGVK